ncbi:branched-chain-amino-acid aminotransferase, cytosolic-like [Octopus vulgaris]|uniref:Branched-chain-amino-acid aminotransferase n=1 Tax=Octopus vulgaris TaxID=6645 RepID=A0AA36BEI1_OCTVU|nr:branched-chain-amino-acid aminotransferase, cytosolic-like [Octopus vulgaris]
MASFLKLQSSLYLLRLTGQSWLPRYSSSFTAAQAIVQKSKNPQPKPASNELVFGRFFTDHMLEIEWSTEGGWGKPQITPFHNLLIHPAAKALHYAVELFEGMKAYRGPDNRIRLFRPMENMNRMNNSAQRVSLPTFDGRELVECIKKLVSLDADWVPATPGDTLYIRPTLVGTEPTLGVSPPNRALLFVIASPVGPYFPTGIKPVTLMADPRYVRSWPGGPGEYKMGSNYAPTLLPQVEALQKSCQQVLWLFGEDHQLTEVGTMNLFIYWINEDGEKELITPPLNGLILPGVTRRSLLELARDWNEFKVSEKEINMKEFLTALNEKRIVEVFGAGTACVVCPVERILYNEEKFALPTMDNGAKLANRFLSTLMDIQFGRVEHKWSEIIE